MDRLLELTARAEQSHFWFRGFRGFVRPEVAQAAGGRPGLRLLDCGCGTGANVAWLAEFGNAFGFDLTANGLSLGRRLGRHRLARASIGAIPVADASVDIATSFDVFQCLPGDVEHHAIREMRRVLKPGGHLILNVAALDVLRGAHSALSEEVRRYTPTRLRTLVEEAGFQVERLTFVHASLFPVMLPVRTAQRWTSRGEALPAEYEITVPPAPVNAALTVLVRLEAAALRLVDMPIGSSLLCHARKAAM
jgi:SAM-dependent methyltransferase